MSGTASTQERSPGAIRPAEAVDRPAIVELLRQLGYDVPPQELERRLRRLREHGAGDALVFASGDDVVAILTFVMLRMLHRPDVCRITALVVREGSRARGIGRALVDEVVRIARASGCGRVEVTSAMTHRGAHPFYERLGFLDHPKRFILPLEP